jgi:hypothetical protein
MDNADSCAEIRPLLAEHALGATGGHERARVVRHVASCPACRRELEQLATVADGLLLLTPPAEPPAGFEAAVIARIAAPADPTGERHQPVRLRRRMVALAAGVLAAALAGGVAGATVTREQGADDRTLAEQYRQVLSVADGQYMRAVHLTTDSGADVGTIFLYQGRPSWILASVADAPENGAYDMVVTYADGTKHTAGVCRVAGGTGTTAYQLRKPATDIAAITLTGPGGRRLTTAGG